MGEDFDWRLATLSGRVGGHLFFGRVALEEKERGGLKGRMELGGLKFEKEKSRKRKEK